MHQTHRDKGRKWCTKRSRQFMKIIQMNQLIPTFYLDIRIFSETTLPTVSSTWLFQKNALTSKPNCVLSIITFQKLTWTTRLERKNSNTEGKRNNSRSCWLWRKRNDWILSMKRKSSTIFSSCSTKASQFVVNSKRNRFSLPKSVD